MYKNITIKKFKLTNNAVYNTTKMLRSGKCTSVYTLTGKAHSTTSGYIKTVEEIKKYSIIKRTPEKSVAYFFFYIQLYNVSQKERKKTAQQAAGNVDYMTTTGQTKAKSQRYTILTHAGLPLQSNKDLAPCMLVRQLLKNPPTKMGRHGVQFIVHTQNRQDSS